MKIGRSENLVYLFLVALLSLSLTGLPFTRYAVYTAPFIALILWIASGKPTLHLDRAVAPFVLLLALGVLTLINYDFNVFKKTYFVFVYVSIFVLFDFSKIEIDYRKLAVFLVFLLLVRLAASGRLSGLSQIQFSVSDSKSSFESTLAFPIGILVLYFFLVKRYLWSAFMMIVAIFALKRVVLLALAISILAAILPKALAKKIINPITVSLGLLLGVFLIVQFSLGEFDQFIFDYFEMAPNELSKGRQVAWRETLDGVEYSFGEFLFLGVGLGKTIGVMQEIYGREAILLHSDLLGMLLEGGYLFFIVFVFLLNNLKTHNERVMALFLSTLFLTDNVIIYQHVMCTYLLVQASLRRSTMVPEKAHGAEDTKVSASGIRNRLLRRTR